MELTTTLLKKAKALGVDVKYLIMSDLIAIGYSDSDAFTLAYPEHVGLNIQAANSMRNGIVQTQKFKKLVANSRERIKEGLRISISADNIDLISSEDVAREVLMSAQHQPVGSKERAELFMKYQELMRKNDVNDDVSEDAIQFYLPLCCDKCPLLIEWKEKQKSKGKEE